ncbi:MAG: hypothetical protein JOZ41_10845 [Chloroflexi bacterium]|nr:hypothetical protein [Chloroflexota bacterium]
MFRTPASITGWGIAILIVVVMGIIAFTGPYHKVNKAQAVSNLPPLHVRIVTDPRTTGAYTPVTVTVHLHQAITFTNVSDAVHTVSSRDNKTFNSGDISTGGGTWTYRPTVTGRFPYYCVYHPLMHGTLVVVS